MEDTRFKKLIAEAPPEEPARQYYFMEQVRRLVEIKKKSGYEALFKVEVIGCQMSARDGEKLSGILTNCGYTPADSVDHSDIVLFTTCTVRENANERLYGRIGRLKHQCAARDGMILGIAGCMMQEKDEAELIRKKYPYVRLIFGTHNVYKLAELLFEALWKDARIMEVLPDSSLIVEDLPSVRKYPFKASVNISYGCNNFCTYCIVPYVRGREKSRNSSDILRECEKLLGEGVIEICLLGQNVNSYGKDLAEDMDFPTLLSNVAELQGLKRLRFMTSNPMDFSEELITVIEKHPNIERHIHLPLQSGSDNVLRRMNRRYTKESFLKLAHKIRERIPGISLTTDVIVGFPGETEMDFQDTLDVLRTIHFDSAFTFIYSRRTGTPAASWEQVPDDIVKDRFARLMATVKQCSRENEGLDIGKTMEVLVEEADKERKGFLTGRLSNNILVHFEGPSSLIGQMANVRLVESRDFYYLGVAASDQA